MNSQSKSILFLTVAWVLSVGVAYAMGWWKGVSSVAHVATGAVSSGLPFILGVMALIAVLSGVAAFRMRGYLNRGHQA